MKSLTLPQDPGMDCQKNISIKTYPVFIATLKTQQLYAQIK